MRHLALAALVSSLCGTALAQPAPARPAPGAAFAAVDADKNGRLSKAEWLAAGRRERGFAFIDADKNGEVTRQEMQAFAKKRAERRPT